MPKQIVFSGIQPSGSLHVGNYLGAIKNWVELQKKYQCIYFIVDWHSLTAEYDPKQKQQQIFETAVDLLAAGIDPKKSILAVQSHVPAHMELMWYLATVTPVARLELMTQYKDKVAHGQSPSAALFTYPILQAADMLLYKANLIPVGEDQAQHIELTREIARTFNRRWSETFPEPEVLLTPEARIMSFVDPTKKMSKSLGPKHYVAMSDDPETIQAKVRSAVTDTGSKNIDMSPGVSNLFMLLEAFGSSATYRKLMQAHSNGTLKYSELKPAVADAIVDYFADFRARRTQLLKKPASVWKILDNGAVRANRIAEKTMKEVRKKTGIA